MRKLTKKQKDAFQELGMFYPEFYDFKGDEAHVKLSRSDVSKLKQSLQTLSAKYSKSDDLNIQGLALDFIELLSIFEEIEKSWMHLDCYGKPLDPFEELDRKRTDNLRATPSVFDPNPPF